MKERTDIAVAPLFGRHRRNEYINPDVLVGAAARGTNTTLWLLNPPAGNVTTLPVVEELGRIAVQLNKLNIDTVLVTMLSGPGERIETEVLFPVPSIAAVTGNGGRILTLTYLVGEGKETCPVKVAPKALELLTKLGVVQVSDHPQEVTRPQRREARGHKPLQGLAALVLKDPQVLRALQPSKAPDSGANRRTSTESRSGAPEGGGFLDDVFV